MEERIWCCSFVTGMNMGFSWCTHKFLFERLNLLLQRWAIYHSLKARLKQVLSDKQPLFKLQNKHTCCPPQVRTVCEIKLKLEPMESADTSVTPLNKMLFSPQLGKSGAKYWFSLLKNWVEVTSEPPYLPKDTSL